MIISKFFQLDKKLDYKGFLILFTILYISSISILLSNTEIGYNRHFLSNHLLCVSIILCLLFYYKFNQINVIYFSHLSLLFYSTFMINFLAYYGIHNIIGSNSIGIFNSIIIILNIIILILKFCNNFIIIYYTESFNNYIKDEIV